MAELTRLYEGKGLAPVLAREVAERLTEHDVFAAHADAELGIDPGQLARPGHAAAASLLAFIVGAVLPLLAITLVPASARIAVTFIAVLAALVGTGQRARRSAGHRVARRSCATCSAARSPWA